MERLKASDFPQEVLKLFDGYVHGMLDRREFLDGATKYAVGGFTAAAMLEALRPNYAMAQQVAKNDPRIKAEYVSYASPQGTGTVKGYLVRPAKVSGKLPAIVVIHENRGLNPYIEDVARRLGVAGFLALAPDGLAPVGGYPGNDDAGTKLQAALEPKKLNQDMLNSAVFLKSHPLANGRMGATGFCWGGGIVNHLAVELGGDLRCGVPFYGSAAEASKVPKIKADLMLHFASDDPRINGQWPGFEAALKAQGVGHEAYVYAGTQHGFHNNSTPRFNPPTAELSWSRTLNFFKRTLVA
jgi:carboxymethylenebutenolidase